MARGGKQIDGQLSLDFCLDPSNYVVQANALVCGKQALQIKSAKLIRAAVMQIKPDDVELQPYVVTIKEISELLDIPTSDVYRDIKDIVNDINNNPVFFEKTIGRKTCWISIPWVQRCEYISDVGVALKLNSELKPFLINLKNTYNYTQYALENILAMKSVYAIRIFELLQEENLHKIIPREGTDIELSLDMIRNCCGIDELKSYKLFSNLRAKVVDVAVNEINRVTLYNVTYSYVKKGRSVVAINFHMNMKYH